VSVIDGKTLRTYKVPDPEDSFAQGQLQEKEKQEEHLRRKVLDQLSYIPGVRIAISVQLDASRKQTRELAYSSPAVAEEQTLSTESQADVSGGEPGVGPNVGQALSGGSTGGRDTTEETTTRYHDQSLTREVTTHHLPFAIQRSAASVGVPRSYIVSVVRKVGGAETDPTEEQIQQQFDVEKRRVQAAVRNIIMAGSEGDVIVEMFPDLEPAMTMLPDGSIAVGSSLPSGMDLVGLLKEYAPQGMLVLLATMGLMTLSRMAKRSATLAAEHAPGPTRGVSSHAGGGDEVITVPSGPVGMVAPSEGGVLEAPEIDENVVRAKHLTEQVVQLVNQDPEAVARIVRRWTEAHS
jgi:flagellar biosynthesis/type III secretory pathway M-ring protein FliF/YscJ